MDIKRSLAYTAIVLVLGLPLFVGAYFYGELAGNIADKLVDRWIG